MKTRSAPPIGQALCPTAFGWVGIAWSVRGLVALTLPRPTEAEALIRLPEAHGEPPIPPAGLDLTALDDKLRRYFQGEPVAFNEPLDPTVGTEFQRRVWTATRAIPRGETRTYGDIARQIGSPGAARAVGQAMARNPWPIIVPCHRVVGHGGRLTGFGGGLDLKRRMLALENPKAKLSAPGAAAQVAPPGLAQVGNLAQPAKRGSLFSSK